MRFRDEEIIKALYEVLSTLVIHYGCVAGLSILNYKCCQIIRLQKHMVSSSLQLKNITENEIMLLETVICPA